MVALYELAAYETDKGSDLKNGIMYVGASVGEAVGASVGLSEGCGVGRRGRYVGLSVGS